MTERTEDGTCPGFTDRDDDGDTCAYLIREGAGLWSGTDAAEEARKARLK